MEWRQIKDAAALSTITAALLYGLVRFSLGFFYDDFGLTPEDVGWDLERTLTTFGPALIVTPVLFFYGLMVVLESKSAELLATRKTAVAVAIVLMLVIAGPIYFESKASKVRNGTNPYDVVLFPVSVPCVELVSLDEGDDTYSTGRLMRLGRSASSVVLFDVELGQVVELPNDRFGARTVDC